MIYQNLLRKGRAHRVGALLTALIAIQLSSTVALAVEFPLQISSDGRRLVDQTGEPFFINGDTPWSIIGQVSIEDAEFYLEDCAARGINSVIVTLVEGFYATNAPANFYGVQPYTTPGQFTTPNEEYFAHADRVIRKAGELGIQVVLAPNYLGCCNDGWLDSLLNDNSESDARWYGEWIGARYRDFPNLLYVWGNDLPPGNARSKIRAMAEGVKAMDPNHLHTYHGASESSALDDWGSDESWLDINITYTYQPVQGKSLEDWNRVPFLPYFLFESRYENDFLNATPLQTRKQAYVAVLSGANGHHYGNFPIWHMNGDPDTPGDFWKSHLDDVGRGDVTHVGALFQSRAWHRLIPDESHELVTSGFGSRWDFVAAALTDNGETAIVYFPAQMTVSLNTGRVSGAEKTAWWFNPRDGDVQSVPLVNQNGTEEITPPDGNDWVLVIDDASKGFAEPGTVPPTPSPNPPPAPPTRSSGGGAISWWAFLALVVLGIATGRHRRSRIGL